MHLIINLRRTFMKPVKLQLIAALIPLSIFSCTLYAMDMDSSTAPATPNSSSIQQFYPPYISYSFQYQQPSITHPRDFCRALLSDEYVHNYVIYLRNAIGSAQFPILYDANFFYKKIYDLLAQCDKTTANTIQLLFCNPLYGNNLIQLINCAHLAGLTIIEIDAIRLLSLAIYGRSWFNCIQQMKFALHNNKPDMVKALLALGVHPNWLISNEGVSAIISGLHSKQDNIVLQLLEAPGVDINTPDIFGRTPLMQAAYNNNPAIIAKLAKLGAQNPSALDYQNKSALDLAVEQGSINAVNALIECFDIDSIDKITSAIKARSLNYHEIYYHIYQSISSNWTCFLSSSTNPIV
jgi:hypothetical protein